MSLQNDNKTGFKKDVAKQETEELIFSQRSAKDKASVGNSKIVQDCDDYIFLNPRKSKHRSSSHGHHGSKKGHHSHHRKKIKGWKRVLLSIVSVLLCLIIAGVGVVFYLLYSGEKQFRSDDYSITPPATLAVSLENDGQIVYYNGHKYKYNDKISTIMFMGVDKRNIEESKDNGTGGQSDVDVLVTIDSEKGITHLINVPRDTMTDVRVYTAEGTYVGIQNMQLCLSYAYGDGKTSSCENTVSSMKSIFYNVPINKYFALDLDGISALNDSVGGVDVTSPETIGSFEEGVQYHLVGEEAESFVRTRDTSAVTSNLSRNERQQVYVKSFMDKLVSQTKADITTPVTLFNASAPYSCTDLDASSIAFLAKEVVTGSGISFEIVNVPGEMKMGEKYAEYYIDEEQFYEQFLSIFYNEVD